MLHLLTRADKKSNDKAKEVEELDLDALEVISVHFEDSSTGDSDSFDADNTIEGLLLVHAICGTDSTDVNLFFQSKLKCCVAA